MKLHLFRSLRSKLALAAFALGTFVLFSGAPAAKANGSDDCNRRVSYTDWRYHEAVEHFGPYSSAARHWAHEHHEAVERCARWREHHHDGR